MAQKMGRILKFLKKLWGGGEVNVHGHDSITLGPVRSVTQLDIQDLPLDKCKVNLSVSDV